MRTEEDNRLLLRNVQFIYLVIEKKMNYDAP